MNGTHDDVKSMDDWTAKELAELEQLINSIV